MRRVLALVCFVAMLALSGCGRDVRAVRLVTTTSVRDSGLLAELLPHYEKETGAKVDLVAVGTGAAFQVARDGNADLLLVHDRKGEEDFIAAGDGLERRDFAWNTFEIVGPPGDPAGVRDAKDGADALARIAKAGAGFISRGDDSGTHRREKKLWEAAGGRPQWAGYREGGSGMGATLTVADETGAYTLTDRGTRLAFAGKLHLEPFVADTKDLRNEYSVVVLSTKKHPQVADAEARRLADWLVSPATAARVEAFKVAGETLFHSALTER
jgi:tungstate transport system substrate-binding protein